MFKHILSDLKKNTTLYDWQKRDLSKFLEVLEKFGVDLKESSLLDVGCSVSTVEFLSKYCKEIVGINLIVPEVIESTNYQILQMNGAKMSFPDNTFDLVYSFNLMEHAEDPERVLSEMFRVTKVSGYIFNMWWPLWNSCRGHHIHEIPNINYQNNGSLIPDWGHLLYSEEEMLSILKEKGLSEEILENILFRIYHRKDLNRIHTSKILSIFYEKGNILYEKKLPAKVDQKIVFELEKRFGEDDYITGGLQVLQLK